jgi:hypothetical protein
VLRTAIKLRQKNSAVHWGAKSLNRRYFLNVLKSAIIMKKILLIIALLGVLDLSSQANAGVRVGVGIGVGPGYYYGGYPYGYYPGPYYYPRPGVYIAPGYYPWYHGYWHGGYYHHHVYYHRR